LSLGLIVWCSVAAGRKLIGGRTDLTHGLVDTIRESTELFSSKPDLLIGFFDQGCSSTAVSRLPRFLLQSQRLALVDLSLIKE
jgi:hypothetical protein